MVGSMNPFGGQFCAFFQILDPAKSCGFRAMFLQIPRIATMAFGKKKQLGPIMSTPDS